MNRKERYYYVYIMTNFTNTTLYTGMTNNIKKRVNDHKEGKIKTSFTFRYRLTKLVYYETYTSVLAAINREKQIKAGSRKKKIELINSINPEWKDLYDDLF